MLSESSMLISITYSDHLDHRLETQQNSLGPAPFNPFCNYYTVDCGVEIRIGPNPALSTIPLFHSPLLTIIFNLWCYIYCLLYPWTSLIPWLASFQYFLNVHSIIYVFNMIILAFEFFYSLSCVLVMACHAKWNQTHGKSDIAYFSCWLSTFRACTVTDEINAHHWFSYNFTMTWYFL